MSVGSSTTQPSQHHKPISVTPQCLAIVLTKAPLDNAAANGSSSSRSSQGNGVKLFSDFLEENRTSFWNPGLVESVSALEFVGFMKPGTLLVSGTEIHLECLRGAWARRVLKPPRGYAIKSLGDIGGIEMQTVPQTQFISLPETLCLLISSMNRGGQPATLDSVTHALKSQYAGMSIPNTELLYGTMAALMSEGKIYCMGEHYFVSTPLMYQHYQAVNYNQQKIGPMKVPNPYHTTAAWDHRQYKPISDPRQDLCSRECQTGASIVNAVPAYKPSSNKRDQATSAQHQTEVITNGKGKQPDDANPTNPSQPVPKGDEKGGFFKRLFRRSKSRELKGKSKQANDAKRPEKQKNESRSSSASGSNQQEKVHPLSSGETPLPPTPLEEIPPLSTFSAQFPPTEWLPCSKYGQAPAAYQGFFSKQRRTRGEKQQTGKDRAAIWVDLDGTSRRDSRRHSRNDPLFMSQRYGTVPENLCFKNVQYSPKLERRSKNKHRLSKYMSSSSECLYCPLPTIPQEMGPRRPKGERRHHRSHKGGGGNRGGADRDQAAGWANNQEVGEGGNLAKFAVSEPYKEPSHHGGSRHSQQTPRSGRTDPSSHERNIINPAKSSPRNGDGRERDEGRDEPALFRHAPAPLAQPTDVDLSTTATTSDELAGREEERRVTAATFEAGREVEPHPSHPIRPKVPLTDEEESGGVNLRGGADKGKRTEKKEEEGEGGAGEEGRRASDSALSASPVVTEMSSASSGGSSNKYSSWSGSEGRHADALREVEEEEGTTGNNRVQGRRDPLDHTYINLHNFAKDRGEPAETPTKPVYYPQRLPSPIHPHDPTYENIAAHLESTQFENMTLEDEEQVMLDGNSNPIRVSSAKINLSRNEDTPVPESSSDKVSAHYISAV